MSFRNTMVMVLVAISFLMLSASAFAIEVGGAANVYLTNNYFWRITPLEVKDPYVQYDFSLSTSIGKLEASLTPWVSYKLDSKEVNEVDYTLDIGYPVGDLSINAGAIYYDVTGAPETTEVYGSAGYETEIGKLVSLSPGVKFYYDVSRYDFRITDGTTQQVRKVRGYNLSILVFSVSQRSLFPVICSLG
jgi:hypothetical protein